MNKLMMVSVCILMVHLAEAMEQKQGFGPQDAKASVQQLGVTIASYKQALDRQEGELKALRAEVQATKAAQEGSVLQNRELQARIDKEAGERQGLLEVQRVQQEALLRKEQAEKGKAISELETLRAQLAVQEGKKTEYEQARAQSGRELEELQARVVALQAENAELKGNGQASKEDARRLIDLYNHLAVDVLGARDQRMELPEGEESTGFEHLAGQVRERMDGLLIPMMQALESAEAAGERAEGVAHDYHDMIYRHKIEKIRQQSRGRQVGEFTRFIEGVNSFQPDLFKRFDKRIRPTRLQALYEAYEDALAREEEKRSEDESVVRTEYAEYDPSIADTEIEKLRGELRRTPDANMRTMLTKKISALKRARDMARGRGSEAPAAAPEPISRFVKKP